MNSLAVVVCSLLYLCGLFGLASWAERRSRAGRSVVNNPYLYALSMAVYCTAWTFYGSVGRAASEGIEFLAIYIGPTLAAPLWWPVLRKMIRICKQQRITNIADFISARYGKSRGLGVLVSLFCVVGIIPYISIQLKAIAGSFSVLSGQPASRPGSSFIDDKALYITLLLASFTILFGARKLEATERHEGMVTAIAVESLIKLVAFLAVGVFVTFGLFHGPADVFRQAAQVPSLRGEFMFEVGHSSADWFWYILLSMSAILFLPRQFQMAVVENVNEQHLRKAMWLFPLYLFLINLFVVPLAFGGRLLLGGAPSAADGYVLSLPLQAGQRGLALLAYLGGFSAATSMIVAEATALSVMLSNNVVMPVLVGFPRWQQFGKSPSDIVLLVRRLAILVVLLLSYVYYRFISSQFSLVTVGLVSFAAVAQFSPAIIGGLFWKQGNLSGARLGLWLGITVWFYTLIVPTMVPTGLLPDTLLTDGPAGLGWLRPNALLGLTTLNPISHGVFWSLLVNIGGYLWGSLNRAQSSSDHQQAVLFVDVFRLSRQHEASVAWKGTANVADLRRLLASFFGSEQADRIVERHPHRRSKPSPTGGEPINIAESELVTLTERLLGGAIGAASARMLVASVTQEEPVPVEEVIQILKTSQEIMAVNKELTRKSDELTDLTAQLQTLNDELHLTDLQKDEFLATVTHEIRTPLTSIRALTEILHDAPDLDEYTRQQFLSTIIRETERLTRLINQVLELERIESGRIELTLEPILMREIISEAISAIHQLIVQKNIQLTIRYDAPPTLILGDRDRLMQVLINLLSNAVKFCEPGRGHIAISLIINEEDCVVQVIDNGIGIAEEQQELIFEKYRQARHRTSNKPTGTGLGLAISVPTVLFCVVNLET